MKIVKGFTLVEVLISSVILFMAIGLGMVAFSSIDKSVHASTDVVTLLNPLPLIVNEIENDLTNSPAGEKTKEGELNEVKYKWVATPEKVLPPKPRFDPDRGDYIEYADRYVMYSISLTLSRDNKSRVFRFRKVGWIKLDSPVIANE
jgi:hypothetical protein